MAPPSGVAEENINELTTTIFPNPCSDRLNISYAYQEPTDLKITAYDVQGRQKFSLSRRGICGSGSFVVNLSDIPEGVYLLNIREGDRQYVEKLIRLR